jgi:UPF0755 protein
VNHEELPVAPVEDAPVREEPPRRRRRALIKLVAFFVALVVVFGGFGLYLLTQTHGASNGRPVSVTIPEGASASTIAQQLAKAGVVRSAWLFRILVRWRGIAGSLKPGIYSMRTNMSYSAVFSLLEQGPKIAFVTVTIPEGRALGQIAQIVHDRLGIPTASFLAAAHDSAFRPDIVPASARDLEGVLFPDTYFFFENATPQDVVRRLTDEFSTKVAGIDFSKTQALGLTPYQTLIVASLVEREAKVEADRAKIASVIYNRLRRHMPLEIDATVQYAIYLRTGTMPNSITVQDLGIASPYNTYKIAALPPGPIASPGLASLQAAAAPASTDYLYYVLSTDGRTHCFASTYQEFLAYKNRTRSCV